MNCMLQMQEENAAAYQHSLDTAEVSVHQNIMNVICAGHPYFYFC